jgi:hypothetical protein
MLCFLFGDLEGSLQLRNEIKKYCDMKKRLLEGSFCDLKSQFTISP